MQTPSAQRGESLGKMPVLETQERSGAHAPPKNRMVHSVGHLFTVFHVLDRMIVVNKDKGYIPRPEKVLNAPYAYRTYDMHMHSNSALASAKTAPTSFFDDVTSPSWC